MNRFLSIAPLLAALLLASGPTSAQRLSVNPYSTSAAPRGPADQDLNFGSITNTICFHHVPAGTTEADVSVRCGSNAWPPAPLCDDPRLREHGVPTLVGTTYFDRPHQVVVHLAFSTACADSGGFGGGSGTSDQQQTQQTLPVSPDPECIRNPCYDHPFMDYCSLHDRLQGPCLNF